MVERPLPAGGVGVLDGADGSKPLHAACDGMLGKPQVAYLAPGVEQPQVALIRKTVVFPNEPDMETSLLPDLEGMIKPCPHERLVPA